MALIFRSLALLAILLCVAFRPAAALDVKRPEVKDFIEHMADTSSFKKRQLRKLLKAAQSQPAIIEAMDRPAEKAKPWFEYRPIFVTEKRIREGTDFWIAHRQALDQASVRSGVAPEYLAAILGVETFYGRLTGSYRVLDALVTLSFDYPARAKFFRDELEQYLLLTRHGRAAIHAFKLPALCRRRGCGWPYRFMEQLGRRVRERRQLSQGTRLECR